MCEVLDRVENKGRTEGRAEGRAQGRAEGISIGELQGKVSVYYNDMHLSPEQIARKVDKPVEDIVQIIKELA